MTMAVGCVRLSSSNILTYLTIITCFILFNCWIYDNTILEYPVRYNSTINYGLQTTKVSTTDRRHGRGKSYLQARILHSTKARSSFQIERIVLSGDIQVRGCSYEPG